MSGQGQVKGQLERFYTSVKMLELTFDLTSRTVNILIRVVLDS